MHSLSFVAYVMTVARTGLSPVLTAVLSLTRASACDVKKTNPPPFCPVERGGSLWCRLCKNLTALAREECSCFGRKAHVIVLASSENEQFAALLVHEFGLFSGHDV